ncbi:MarR family transcriptional regulator [Acidianus sulfidivorans JP7]|uniref:Transcriptional regulator n=1 Tax=Acidianus sulfidivorans JP7 TaxID=619593 RepID=A0A2U9IPH9_9CREN|nr:HTH-type transcriptional regulator Lrs14 [Acidianus sulfidivorans]AWR97959.1 MarR family transcriptional regulator [Acidianus sulfidivorans JP7]
MEVRRIKIKLPTGKEVSFCRLLEFCYGINDTEYNILKLLVDLKKCTEDEIVERLKLSRSTVNRGLNKLVEIGFVTKSKETKSIGRPKYIYISKELDAINEKIIKDLNECARIFKEILPNEITFHI